MKAVMYLIAYLSMLAVVVLLGLTHQAPAHEWYPADCCSGKDCRAVPQEDLEEIKDGWRYIPNGAIFKKGQVRPSQDKHWHVCYGDASVYDETGTIPKGTPIPYCVFIQNSM